MDWQKCHVFWGVTGLGVLLLGISLSGTSGTFSGVGPPIISVKIPIMLWKCVVVLNPPLYQVEKVDPSNLVKPGLFSAFRRLYIAAPTASIPVTIMGSNTWLNGFL